MTIDIVFTWVDNSDPIWALKKKEAEKQFSNLLPEANSEARFMNNDELKYSLRSIHKFAPWVNNIFIVTDNQIPDWLNTSHPKINVVDHREIFYDKSYLPTFSARVIESQIHHIENLSEHFIYFNDDMFLGNTCKPDYFYTQKGFAKIFVSEIIPIPNKKSFDISRRNIKKRNDHQHAIVNTRKLIHSRFNKSIYYNIRHGVKPLLKSVLEEVETIFKDDILKTIRNNFRTENDILPLHLFSYYAIIKKLGKPKYLKTVSSKKKFLDGFSSTNKSSTFGYLNLHENNVEQNLNNIKERKPFIICLNQTPKTPLISIEKIKKFLPEFYPDKSPFEK